MAELAQLTIECLARHRAQIDRDPLRRERVRALQRFQVERLRWTFADGAARRRYRAALEFFVPDLNGLQDHPQRDRDLHKVVGQWAWLLPTRGLHAVSRALELGLLTYSLDVSVLDALKGTPPDFETYPAAYRVADRFEDRRRQIAIMLAAGRDLDSMLAIPALGTALRVARVPARMGVADPFRLHKSAQQRATDHDPRESGKSDPRLRMTP